jgi:hypothetical protein
MSMRRRGLLTNGFIKKLENHICAVVLYFLHCNFSRVHKTLRVTHAMEAGIANHVWSMEELAALLEVKGWSTSSITSKEAIWPFQKKQRRRRSNALAVSANVPA